MAPVWLDRHIISEKPAGFNRRDGSRVFLKIFRQIEDKSSRRQADSPGGYFSGERLLL
jgi:hypothetical protein